MAKASPAALSGFAIVVLGSFVMLAWWAGRPELAGIVPGFAPMTLNSAVSLLLSGMALLLPGNRPAYARQRVWLAGLVLLLAGLTLVQYGFDTDLGIDRLLYPAAGTAMAGYSGRMALDAAVAFALGALVFMLACFSHVRWAGSLAQVLAVGVVFLGLLGISGYLLNLEDAFGAHPASEMAQATAFGILVLGLGLWFRIHRTVWYQERYAGREHEQIHFIGGSILIFLVLSAGLASFGVLKKQTEGALKNTLSMARDNRVLLFQSEIQAASLAVRELAVRPRLMQLMSDADAAGPDARRELARIIQSSMGGLFSGIRLLGGGNAGVLAEAGQLTPLTPLQATLNLPEQTTLFWRDGWMLKVEVPFVAGGRERGRLVADVPLRALDEMWRDMVGLGRSGEVVVCAPRGPRHMMCFPHRLKPAGTVLRSRQVDGRPLPMSAALEGQSAVTFGLDYRQSPVVNAYAPIGALGLGMIVKMDEAELYEPIHQQMQQLFLLLFALALGGMLLLRWQVMPLVRRLTQSERTAQQTGAQLQRLLEALPLAVFFKDGKSRWQVVNSHGLRLFRLARLDWQGKTDRELVRMVPALREALEACAADDEKVWQTQARHDSHELIPDALGRLREFEVAKVPLFEVDGTRAGLVVVANDITERKQAESRIQALGRYNRSLIEANLDALATVTCDGIITDVNLAFESMTGLPRHALINTEIFAYTSDPERAREGLRLVVHNGTVRDYGMEIRHQDGHSTPVEFNATVFHDERGDVAGVYAAARDITERRIAEDRVHRLAYYDTLTGLPNRLLFKDRLQQALAQAERGGQLVAVMFLDLDRFKLINDTLGHGIGDLLLRGMGERLSLCVRESDTVARMGGDEFTVILSGLHKGQDAALVARKILDAFAQPFWLEGHELFVNASIGIALYPSDSQTPEGLLKQADLAMYAAKEQGNHYQFYTAAMNVISAERLALENALRHAMEAGQLSLHYQPQIDLESGAVVGMEALLRWQRPEQGFVSPAEFIPLAEETGLILPIGDWVLRTACAQNKAWQEAGFAPLRVAVNLSARQFKQQNLVQTIRQALRDSGLEPRFLELELTESIFMQHEEASIRKLRELKAMGIKISIDDFGTGYSSLGYLQRFPVDKLKIDRSFVRDITDAPDDAAIAKAIIAMARSLNLEVIAEGVETEAQLAFLRSNACCLMQGFYFSRPLSAEAFGAFLAERSPTSPADAVI
ncbi:MAG: EAL domain-containing protein [Pseudomonadota bacterium]